MAGAAQWQLVVHPRRELRVERVGLHRHDVVAGARLDLQREGHDRAESRATGWPAQHQVTNTRLHPLDRSAPAAAIDRRDAQRIGVDVGDEVALTDQLRRRRAGATDRQGGQRTLAVCTCSGFTAPPRSSWLHRQRVDSGRADGLVKLGRGWRGRVQELADLRQRLPRLG